MSVRARPGPRTSTSSTSCQGMNTPMGILLPVLGVMSVTSEWSQRTAMVTFTLEPSRSRVVAAKFASVMIVAVAALVIGLVMGVDRQPAVRRVLRQRRGVGQPGEVRLLLPAALRLRDGDGLRVRRAAAELRRPASSSTSSTRSCCRPCSRIGAALMDWFESLQPWIDFNNDQNNLIDATMQRQGLGAPAGVGPDLARAAPGRRRVADRPSGGQVSTLTHHLRRLGDAGHPLRPAVPGRAPQDRRHPRRPLADRDHRRARAARGEDLPVRRGDPGRRRRRSATSSRPPAFVSSILLPVVGIMLVTSEWSQRTAMTTFTPRAAPDADRDGQAAGRRGADGVRDRVRARRGPGLQPALRRARSAPEHRLDLRVVGFAGFVINQTFAMLGGFALACLLLNTPAAIVVVLRLQVGAARAVRDRGGADGVVRPPGAVARLPVGLRASSTTCRSPAASGATWW